MYGAKYHVVQMPRERQPSKIVLPVDSEYRPAPSTSTIFIRQPTTTHHSSV